MVLDLFKIISAVHSPLFFGRIVRIHNQPLQAAILVSKLPSVAWGRVSNIIMEWGMVWEEQEKSTPTAINPRVHAFSNGKRTRSQWSYGNIWDYIAWMYLWKHLNKEHGAVVSIPRRSVSVSIFLGLLKPLCLFKCSS